MQIWLAKLALSATALVLLSCAAAQAEDAVPVELGTTSHYLPNNAYSHDKHYLEQDDDLLGRIACLLEDVDYSLARLHALPPELAGNTAFEQQASSQLAGLLAVALENNPRLGPLRSQLVVEAAQARQAGAKPDPMVMFNVANLPVPQFELQDTPMTQFVLGWSQQYVSYGKRGLRREIASLDGDIAELAISQEELDIIGGISASYYKLAATQARLNVLDDNAKLLELLLELGERKLALGLTPQTQVLSAQRMLADIEQQRIKLGSALARQQEMIYGLLGRPEDMQPAGLDARFAYALPVPGRLDSETLLTSALKSRPDWQSLGLKEQQQKLKLELASRMYRPDYTLSASYGLRYGKRDFFTAGVSIPVFTHKAEKQDAAVQEAAAGLDVIDGNRDALENMLATEIALMEVDLRRIADLGELYRSGLVPQARLELDSAIAGYAANKIDFSEMIRSQQALLSYELELEQLYIEYHGLLSGLQVLTAGAFNPQPFLSIPAPASGAAGSNLPGSALRMVEDEEKRQLGQLMLDHQQWLFPGVNPPGIDGSLIDRLALPVPEQIEPEADGQKETSPASQEVQAEEEARGDTSPADDFYKPYTPAGNVNGGADGEESDE